MMTEPSSLTTAMSPDLVAEDDTAREDTPSFRGRRWSAVNSRGSRSSGP